MLKGMAASLVPLIHRTWPRAPRSATSPEGRVATVVHPSDNQLNSGIDGNRYDNSSLKAASEYSV
jgi:hypothetical protein